MNYCSECGFKIEGKYNFCPNCGSRIGQDSFTAGQVSEESTEKIICKNCGEANEIENLNCYSCGVILKGSAAKIPKNRKRDPEKNIKLSSPGKFEKEAGNNIRQVKTLDNKKVLIIAASVIVIFVISLVVSGVFEPGTETGDLQTVDESGSNGSGINLANIEEINKLETKVNENPDDLESVLHLAHMQQDAGLSEKAIMNYKKYLVKFPENADARVDMAICYYNLNDYNTAIKEMETAIEYQPGHQIAYLNLGIVNLTAKNLEASKEWFRKTVELDPNSEAGKRAQELLQSH